MHEFATKALIIKETLDYSDCNKPIPKQNEFYAELNFMREVKEKPIQSAIITETNTKAQVNSNEQGRNLGEITIKSTTPTSTLDTTETNENTEDIKVAQKVGSNFVNALIY